MPLDFTDCLFTGPALPEPFVKFELEKELTSRRLFVKNTGDEGKKLKEEWTAYRRKLYNLTAVGGPLRIRNHVIEPLLPLLGYARFEDAGEVQTREGLESGGTLLLTDDGNARLRIWTAAFDEDLYAPSKRGNAWRFSHLRVAQRVLLTAGERVGLLSNGVQLLILLSDPARPDSVVTIPVESGWKRNREVPDSFRLVLALCCPAGIAALPGLVEKARLQQARVTKELRVQARQAVERFTQEILDNPANSEWFAAQTDRDALAKQLWHEGLYIVYRLLFVFKLESTDDPARSFSFASTSLWRNTFSPSIALAPYARRVLDSGAATGSLLENGIRSLFRMFEEGIECTELNVKPLGGSLFGKGSTPILSDRTWGERAVALLLDKLLWTPPRRGSTSRERVHYGPLDVEDLGRVYEALLELEPGISGEQMCRLRRSKLEVVVPFAQGEKYRPVVSVEPTEQDEGDELEAEVEEPEAEDEAPPKGKKTKVEWIEEIPPGRFYLRVGLGRKATGSFYTPHSFVRFLILETLGPQVEERSPRDNPQPMEILKLKVLDPAMGSGHFLVEACRFLGDKLYEACRLCDDLTTAFELEAEAPETNEEKKLQLTEQADEMRQRVIDLPDPEDELLRYLPSRSVDGEASGYSQKRAEALCRRLVATHCLYGVDKNPLAVELAKLALWLESHAEGMPLTFMDHRLVAGDSLTGPFWDILIFRPGKPDEPLDNLFHEGLNKKLAETLRRAVRKVQELEATVGVSVADIRHKEIVKAELDRALLPFHIAAAAWSGGVMLGPKECDDTAYGEMLQAIANSGDLPERIENEKLRGMIARGLNVDAVPEVREGIYEKAGNGKCVPSLAYDLTFPEVFYPSGQPWGREGFDAVVGNPPWEGVDTSNKEFFASFDFSILSIKKDVEISELIAKLIKNTAIEKLRIEYNNSVSGLKNAAQILLHYCNQGLDKASGATPDMYQFFTERGIEFLSSTGFFGMVLPASVHSNESANGLRNLLVNNLNLLCCFSFENRKRLFEIDIRKKYATIIAKKGGSTSTFQCAFYLQGDEWLFSENKNLHV
jgi:hypothetical protein